LTFIGALVAFGCGDGDREVTPLLTPLDSCAAVEDSLRQALTDQMHEALTENLETALRGGCRNNRSYGWDANSAPPSAAAGAGKTSGSSGGASQVSTTNNQVAGVDEADFVKNDNKHIYILGGGYLRIVRAWPAPQTKELSKTKIEGTAKKLFVSGKRALVYSSLPSFAAAAGSSKPSGKMSPGWTGNSGSTECTYGYNCSFTGDGRPTLVTVFDISDLSKPVKVRELRMSGSYVNARRVGGAVYTVTSAPGVTFKGVKNWPDKWSYCGAKGKTPEEIHAAFEALRHENAWLMAVTPISDLMPRLHDTRFSGGKALTTTKVLGQCKGFYKSQVSAGSQFTTLVGLEMTRDEAVKTSTIISKPGAVYASASALYMSVPHQNMGSWRWGGWNPVQKQDELSTVHKFKLMPSNADVAYAASGAVKGRVLNQFSMDEYDSHLRIATTTGRLPSKDVHSTLTVLRQGGGALRPTGMVDKLAPTEDIRSVRFDGPRAFMVTFKKTDPLFTFDLSDPYNPHVKAELKIPGFSTYMHMLDKSHLLTIGYDANDQGSFAWFTGVMLQIFDVSDMSNPRRVFRHVIGTRGSSSVALNNHLAFNYFAPKKLLALPMTVCEGTGPYGGSYGKNMTFSGLMVFDTTTTSGFDLRGKVSHPAGSGVTCSNWWTRANSQVKRSIIMDDYVFSISGEQIKVNHLDQLSKDVASVSLK